MVSPIIFGDKFSIEIIGLLLKTVTIVTVF